MLCVDDDNNTLGISLGDVGQSMSMYNIKGSQAPQVVLYGIRENVRISNFEEVGQHTSVTWY